MAEVHGALDSLSTKVSQLELQLREGGLTSAAAADAQASKLSQLELALAAQASLPPPAREEDVLELRRVLDSHAVKLVQLGVSASDVEELRRVVDSHALKLVQVEAVAGEAAEESTALPGLVAEFRSAIEGQAGAVAQLEERLGFAEGVMAALGGAQAAAAAAPAEGGVGLGELSRQVEGLEGAVAGQAVLLRELGSKCVDIQAVK